MHFTSPFGLVSFFASHDKYTTLVKIGNVASEHVRRADSGMYLWWNVDTVNQLSFVTFLLVMWPVLFQSSARCLSLLSVGVVEKVGHQ